MTTEFKLKLACAVAIIVMALNAAVPFFSTASLSAAQNRLEQSQQVIDYLNNFLSTIKDAETGQRGFVITGKEEFLDPYHRAMAELAVRLPQMEKVTSTISNGEAHVKELQRFTTLKMDDIHRKITLRRQEGFAAVEPIISSGQGKHYMDRLQMAADQLIRLETMESNALAEELRRSGIRAMYLGVSATVLDILLLMVALVLMFRMLKERLSTAQAQEAAGVKLSTSMQQLERRNEEILMIGRMSRALEAQISLKEAFGIISLYYAKLLPNTSGVLYLFRNSGDLLEKEAQWGTPQSAEPTILPHACWALRRGHAHTSEQADELPCPHYLNVVENDDQRLCLPLMAQGEVLGLIYIEAHVQQDSNVAWLSNKQEDLAISISEQVALALSNARLRQVLREQSITDPLTGMFNRRFMEETLQRELARSARAQSPLSVIVFDLDHFKKINDVYGHDAGDRVLQAVAGQVKSIVRASDVPCRFGGEEFVLILPDCKKDMAIAKANRIAEELRKLSLEHGGRHLGRISASIGVASFPEDAEQADVLFQAADQAMYQGKKNGRDQVVAAAPNRGEHAKTLPESV